MLCLDISACEKAIKYEEERKVAKPTVTQSKRRSSLKEFRESLLKGLKEEDMEMLKSHLNTGGQGDLFSGLFEGLGLEKTETSEE